MKVCFVGFGSIAKRHITNLAQICQEQEIELTIDLCRHGDSVKERQQQYLAKIHKVYYGVETMPDDYDVVFVTNPTKCHYETLKATQGKATHFFIEKPVFDQSCIDLSDLRFAAGGIQYVACPLRYMNVIQYLKQNIDYDKIYSVRCISSSYLPEWRAGMDYRATYSAHKKMGGGVAIDLIHEWDYITYLMGVPREVLSIQGKFSELEIDSEDLALYIARYENKCVELHLDYFGRVSIRKIELYGKEDTIIGDLIAGTVSYARTNRIVDLSEKRDDYQKKELEAFLRMINKIEPNGNDIENACMMLRLAKGDNL